MSGRFPFVRELRRVLSWDLWRGVMDYRVDDKQLQASVFLSFVNQVWPGNYDIERTQNALSKTLNITAYDNKMLVGCLRILLLCTRFLLRFWSCGCRTTICG